MNVATGALVTPLLLAVVLIAWAIRHGRRRSAGLAFDDAAYPGLRRLRDAGVASRRIGLALGALGCGIVLMSGDLGRFALAGPSIGAIAAIGAVLIGQRLLHGAAASPGLAGIERRTARDYVPRRRSIGLMVAVGFLAAAAAFTTLAASADDQGRTGRALTYACTTTVWESGVASEVTTTGGSGPFPGAFYTVPMVVALVALLAVGAGALVLIAGRPRNGSDAELVRVDDALRRITSEGVLAFVGLGVGITLLELATLAYVQFGKGSCVPTNVAASYTLALVAFGALIYALRCLIVAAVPGNGEKS